MPEALAAELAGETRHRSRARAFRLLAGSVAALFIAFASLGAAFIWYDDATGWVTHTHHVRSGIGDILQSLTDAESAQRGYVLTGDRTFRDRIATAETQAQKRLAAIERLTADNPEQQARIATLRAQMAKRLAIIDRTAELRSHGDAVMAIRTIRQGEGIRAMEAIRVLVRELDAAEAKLETERTQRAAAIRYGVMIALAVFAVLLGLLFTKAFRDLDREREAEAGIAERLRALVAERTLLLDEVNHRVKNSLQQIASVVRLQSRALTNPEAREALEKTLDRIMAVGRVHEQLYRSGGALGLFDAGDYTEGLARELVASMGRADVTLETDVEPARLDMRQAAPLAIILNELITNALKYGCPPGRACIIRVAFMSEGEDYRLSVSDDGAGLPKGFTPISTKSLGMRAITALAGQLGGRFVVESPERGATFSVVFPKS
jgi:two-component sensor histidine kinase